MSGSKSRSPLRRREGLDSKSRSPLQRRQIVSDSKSRSPLQRRQIVSDSRSRSPLQRRHVNDDVHGIVQEFCCLYENTSDFVTAPVTNDDCKERSKTCTKYDKKRQSPKLQRKRSRSVSPCSSYALKYDKKAKGNDDKKTNDDKLAHCKISPLLKRNERWDKEWESVKNDIHGARPKRKAVAKASLVSRAVCDQVAQQFVIKLHNRLKIMQLMQ